MAAATAAPATDEEKPIIRLGLCKGRMKDNVIKLFGDAGIKVTLGNERAYRPSISWGKFDAKLLKVSEQEHGLSQERGHTAPESAQSAMTLMRRGKANPHPVTAPHAAPKHPRYARVRIS